MAKQITQKQFYTALISLVEQNPDFTVKADGLTATAEDTVKFLEGRIENLDKKATKTSDKVNTDHAEVDGKVLSVMTTEKRKVGEIAKAVNTEYEVDYSSSKVTASLRRLCENGAVKNVKEAKYSYYFLAD